MNAQRAAALIMKEPTLFRLKRVCCICLCEATRNRGAVVPGEPLIHSVSPYLWWRRRGKGVNKACPSVSVCEECLIRTLQHAGLIWHPSGRNLARALLESILASYKTLLEAEPK
jgi:hypothetical protein